MWPLMLLGYAKNVIAFVLKYWKEVVLGLMIGTIAYQNLSHTRYVLWADTIPYLVDQNKQLTVDLKTAVDANKTLTSSIGGLNSVVNDWKTKSDQLQKENDQLQGKLDGMKMANDKIVKSILNAPTPKTCDDSIAFLRSTKQQLTWSAK